MGTPPKITLSDAPAVAACLPHLLGFHPRESLICLWIDDGALVATQRADLPESRDPQIVDAYVEAFRQAAAHVPAREAIAVCVSDDAEWALNVLTRFRNRFPDLCRGLLIVNGSQVGDITDEGVLWQWVGISYRDMASRQLDRAGVQTPAQSRADIEAECQPNDAVVQALGADEPEESASVAALLAHIRRWDPESVVRGGEGHSLSVDARVLRDATATVEGRDLVMAWAAWLPITERKSLLHTLFHALRGTPDNGEPVANVAASACAVAWLCGDGVRANAAVNRCLRAVPDHVMGGLLDSVLQSGIPPHVVARTLRQGPLHTSVNESPDVAAGVS